MSAQDASYKKHLEIHDQSYSYYDVNQIEGVEKLPYSLIILLENILRNTQGEAREQMVDALLASALKHEEPKEISFMPARVLLTDFTGVPCMVDLAAMRDAVLEQGQDPSMINPLIPVDLVIDHSVIADKAGCPKAHVFNEDMEFERNKERYSFLKWAQQSFDNLQIVPPATGICHQLNLEKLASVVYANTKGKEALIYPDTLIGADSHTTTVNGISVLAWGVGGIEAEAAMLGQAVSILIPKVIGIKLTGALKEGVTAFDLSLSVAERLRSIGVVGKFVEFFGEGLMSLSANDRATVANMSPEYGCTVSYFAIDQNTLDFLYRSGRDEHQVKLVEAYAKDQGLWFNPQLQKEYEHVIELDLSEIEPVIAGPKKPHEKIYFSEAKKSFREICQNRGLSSDVSATLRLGDEDFELTHGAIAIAAITSCTSMANPDMLLALGLLAKNACEAGIYAKPWVKKMFSPGSKFSQSLMDKAGLSIYLDAQGFYTSGFGCMSCIGNSGPLSERMQEIGKEIELCAVLSGNRNFEGRIGPDISQNYLATPHRVLAYALAGSMDFDFEAQALGQDKDGKRIYLKDLLPSEEEIAALKEKYLTRELYLRSQENMFAGSLKWQELDVKKSSTYSWDESSTYVQKPPYFEDFSLELGEQKAIKAARTIVKLGDFVTTDHISPAGSIDLASEAAAYLQERGVLPQDFNTYGSRRGNHEVMMRGAFSNIKLSNELALGKLGGYTYNFNTGEISSIFSAAQNYAQDDTDLVVLAGQMYGSGSSRDWAAKGPMLIGVSAVFARSFERIHRSNLIGMGVLPLEFIDGEDAQSLGLDGSELFDIDQVNLDEGPFPQKIRVCAHKSDGSQVSFEVLARIDTAIEGLYVRHGGILTYMLRKLLA